MDTDCSFPVICSDDIISRVEDFRGYIRGAVVPKIAKSQSGVVSTERQTIKDVASAVWKRLSKGFHKDKPHYQTLYTFEDGSQLDCFGLAYAVVAGCQVLGCTDVHLNVSEDHAWIAFGADGSQTAEITWHGKQKEVYRGEPIDNGLLSRNNWLYLGGNSVVCSSRRMEATAAVAMMNPAIDNNESSDVVKLLQRDLMWMLYDAGCFSRYPMAICVLADVQELCAATERPDVDDLYYEAIDCSRSYYKDSHVYPYSQYGCYLNRKQSYELALFRWQQAANVLRQYSYNREEEELHKEFQKIAHDLIPSAFKQIDESGTSSFFDKTDNLANFILFYDGICEWEQNGTVPVLHGFWARPFTQSVSYFPLETRVTILSPSSGGAESTSVVPASLPYSPVKNVEAYHKSLVDAVVNIYGAAAANGAEGNQDDAAVSDFVRMCETKELKADLVWNPEVVSPSKAEKPVSRSLQLRSRKMESLRGILTKSQVRVVDVDLFLSAPVNASTAAPSASSGGRRVSERKRRRIV